MQKARMVQTAVFQAIADIYRNPAASTPETPSLSRPWNVYTEADLRNAVSVTSPYVYLLDADSPDLSIKLPTIVIEFAEGTTQFQMDLGSYNFAKAVNVTFHCLGRNRGESSDMGSYIAETLRSINIYDYNHPTSLTTPPPILDTRPAVSGNLPTPYWPTLQTLQIDPGVRMARLQVPAKQKFQGMILGAQMVKMRFLSSF